MRLTAEDKTSLLDLARRAVIAAASRKAKPDVALDTLSQVLQDEGASFVTLTKQGQLRGCIGSLEARRPLVIDVRENAIAAATSDPRFPPVRPDEVEELQVEVSVLSPPEPLAYDDAEDLLKKLRPGVDGVVIERGGRRGTFLPQVWEQLPDPKQFMDRLCRKAFLPGGCYQDPGLKVYTYQVEKFTE